MDHAHRCVYCGIEWDCDEACPFRGSSVCTDCRDRVTQSPDTPWRVIPLRDWWILDRLVEYDSDRIRETLRRFG